jgi:hypothetical protein
VHVLADVLGALEHHVLEEVGEAALARDLVAAADVVPDVDGDQRGGAVLVKDHLEAVGELVALELDVHGGRGLCRAGSGCAEQRRSEREGHDEFVLGHRGDSRAWGKNLQG